MAIAETIQKNIAQNSEDTAEGVDRLEGKQDLANELGETLNETAEKGNLIAQRALLNDEDEIRRQKEKDREDARKDKGDGDGGKKDGVIKKAGKGIFGLLGSIVKVLGGSFMKILKPMWKVLKILFKVLKFTALGVGILAAGLFFSMSASEQEAIIDKVVGFFKKVGEVLSSLGKAFGAAFMKNMDDMTDEEGNPIEGLVSKFGKFKEAWSGVLEKLSGISLSVGGKTYKGLEGMATMLGDMFGKIAGFFLDLGTAIAEFIMDPRKMLVKMSVAVSNFFGGMIDTIGNFIDEFTSMEFLLSLLPPWMRKWDKVQEWTKDASEKRAKEKAAEMDKLLARDKLLNAREAAAQKQYQESNAKMEALDAELNNEKIKLSEEERKKKEAERDVHNENRLAALDLQLEAKAEKERNKDRFANAKEAYEKSTEIALKERANQIQQKKTGKDFVALEEELQKQQEEKQKLLDKHVEGSGFWGEIEVGLDQARKIQELLGVEGTKAGREKLTQADLDKSGVATQLRLLGIDSDDVGNLSKIKDLLSGLQVREEQLAGTERRIKKSEATKADLAPAMEAAYDLARKEKGMDKPDLGVPVLKPAGKVKTTHTGGIITEGGIIAAQKGEIIVDDILVNTLVTAAEAMSGISLMNLQRDQQASTGTGAPIIIQDNSQKQVNQSQPLVLPNSPIQPGNDEAPRLLN